MELGFSTHGPDGEKLPHSRSVDELTYTVCRLGVLPHDESEGNETQ